MIQMKESEMLQDNFVEVEKKASIVVSKTVMMPLNLMTEVSHILDRYVEPIALMYLETIVKYIFLLSIKTFKNILAFSISSYDDGVEDDS